MDGPVGLKAFAQTLLESEDCDRSQAWLFGLELVKTLNALDWTRDPFRTAKERVVESFVSELEAQLRALAPDAPWCADVMKHYGGRP